MNTKGKEKAAKALPSVGAVEPKSKSRKTVRSFFAPCGEPPLFNRETSWIAFNRRVLEQARNPNYPLLERVRFLAFVSSNLDEFFEIRVSGLMQQVETGLQDGLDTEWTPSSQLQAVLMLCQQLVSDQYACWNEELKPALQAEGLVFKNMKQLTRAEMAWVENYFQTNVYPVLTPLGIDPAHPFPQMTNKALNVLVCLKPHPGEEDKLAIIPVPRILPRVLEVNVKRTRYRSYLFLSDIIRHFAERLFPGYEIRSTHGFRVTRNSDLYIDEEEVQNLLLTIEEELHKLRKGAAVRLEIASTAPDYAVDTLLDTVHMGRENVFRLPGPINLMRLMSVYDLIDRPDLKFPPFIPHVPPELAEPAKIFEAIGRKDFLLHHPFDSFSPVVDFISQAARDPDVFAIKQTLYRTSGDSPIVQALIEASQNGKQVTALIELKARFDEANNILWARRMEEAGVHVVYGLVGLKTHCKCCLVVRRESGGLRRYAHLGSGNYNPKTARLYTDFSFFTANPAITTETADLFNTLTGFASTPRFRSLLVAPFNLHESLQKFIRQETLNAKAGKHARIIIKVNSLIDREIILSLYEAARAGVKIDLIVRGICGLVPGIKGLSDNIRVRSILGRYLEHSRVFYFQNFGRKPRLFLGSADWMPRNFYRRIEAVFPVQDTDLRRRILDVLKVYLKDNVQAKQLRANGSYAKLPGETKALRRPVVAQDVFAREATALREEEARLRALATKDETLVEAAPDQVRAATLAGKESPEVLPAI